MYRLVFVFLPPSLSPSLPSFLLILLVFLIAGGLTLLALDLLLGSGESKSCFRGWIHQEWSFPQMQLVQDRWGAVLVQILQIHCSYQDLGDFLECFSICCMSSGQFPMTLIIFYIFFCYHLKGCFIGEGLLSSSGCCSKSLNPPQIHS